VANQKWELQRGGGKRPQAGAFGKKRSFEKKGGETTKNNMGGKKERKRKKKVEEGGPVPHVGGELPRSKNPAHIGRYPTKAGKGTNLTKKKSRECTDCRGSRFTAMCLKGKDAAQRVTGGDTVKTAGGALRSQKEPADRRRTTKSAANAS